MFLKWVKKVTRIRKTLTERQKKSVKQIKKKGLKSKDEDNIDRFGLREKKISTSIIEQPPC